MASLSRDRRYGVLALAAAAPLLLAGLFVAAPALDVVWENQPAHFWLVLGAAAVSLGLAAVLHSAARRRADARLLLVSLAFIAATGALGLHALATPGVLLGRNAGFELATPVGLVAAGLFIAASSAELRSGQATAVIRRATLLLGGLLAGLVLWAVLSLAELPPLDDPLGEEQLDGWQIGLALAGVALYALAAAGYLRLWRRRSSALPLVVTVACALLADAMLVIAWATNWQLSWWEWHVLLLLAVGVVALAARAEWHEERFSALYLDETLAGAKDVSIIFADLSGFTSFSERTDDAGVTAMLNAYFERLVPLLEEHGGDVHQLVGDEIMAIFNKRGDQPEHALLASRAGLALQAAAGEVAAAHTDWPRFRVGVNSGEVIAGVVGGPRGHRKHGVVGDTVNLAARLQSEAPVDCVLIGAQTAAALPPGAVLERLPALRVKGKQEPVEAFLLHRLPEVS
jgi:class 3 adenylate cyclase